LGMEPAGWMTALDVPQLLIQTGALFCDVKG